MADSVDTDQTPLSAASHLSLHYWQRPICASTKGYHDINILKVLTISDPGSSNFPFLLV